MTRAIPTVGWALLVAFFGVIVAMDYIVVADLYRPPEGPWPGWTPLIVANVIYGGGGLLVAMAIRWVWRKYRPQR